MDFAKERCPRIVTDWQQYCWCSSSIVRKVKVWTWYIKVHKVFKLARSSYRFYFLKVLVARQGCTVFHNNKGK